MSILAFAASNSRTSINYQLAHYAASLVPGGTVETLDINDYELPLFSIERERAMGEPALARAFYDRLGGADALVIAFAEHNGGYTAAWKNLFDWVSRIDKAVFQNKPSLFLSTSPGPGGAASVLASAVKSAGFFGADLKGSLSVPSFNENFDAEKAVLRNPALDNSLRTLANGLTTQRE